MSARDDKERLQSLPDYISDNYGTNAAFADHIGVSRQQVSNWISKGFMVCNHAMYSKRREFPEPIKKLHG